MPRDSTYSPPSNIVHPANRIVKLMLASKLSVITAESCTAGLLAGALSNGEGASNVLQGGFITYTKAQKAKALGVSTALLKREGSVTARVAEELARGALRRSNADIAIAVTGVLGPTPDEDGNPVGLVYFCCVRRGGGTKTLRKQFRVRDRDRLCATTIRSALRLLEQMVASRGRPLRL
jgi:nicotinamide-nucleotide amidase